MHTLLKYNVCSMGLALLVIPLFDFGAPIRNERDVKHPLFYYKIVQFSKSGYKLKTRQGVTIEMNGKAALACTMCAYP